MGGVDDQGHRKVHGALHSPRDQRGHRVDLPFRDLEDQFIVDLTNESNSAVFDQTNALIPATAI